MEERADQMDLRDAQWQPFAPPSAGGNVSPAIVTHDVLRSTPARTLLAPFARVAGTRSYNLDSAKPDVAADPRAALQLAVLALQAFVQANWTGPNLEEELLKPALLLRRACPDAFPARSIENTASSSNNSTTDDDDEDRQLREASINSLTYAGEPAYHLCEAPFLLVLSLRVLDALRNHDKEVPSLPWWRLRATSVHARVVDSPFAPGEQLLSEATALEARLAASQAHASKVDLVSLRKLRARLLTDHALTLQRSGRNAEGNDKLLEAAKVSGLRYKLTGALGKRTKFQKDEKTILVLVAESVEQEEQSVVNGVAGAVSDLTILDDRPSDGWKAAAAPNGSSDMPSEYLLNDNILLERTRFTENADVPLDNTSPLDPLDSTILLGLCLNISNTAPENGLTASEMLAFVDRVLAHPRNWSVHTMALLLRSRLESKRTRTAQRAALQLQALIDQMPTEDSSLEERLFLFHELELPSKWEMQAELARMYAAMGVVRSALEIFERLELYQEAIECYGALGRQDQGIALVRDLLEGRKTEPEQAISDKKSGLRSEQMQTRLNRAREAKLWCLLGDMEVEHAEKHYSKAWEVSQESSGRAARSLGGLAFAKGDIDTAVMWIRRALRLQPLLARSWFMLGCAYMRQDTGRGWLEAARCFRRCTALDDEDAESWNNLASCYLRLGQQSRLVIQEAARAEETNAEVDQRAVLYDDVSDDDTASERSSDSGIGMASSGDETEVEEEDTMATLQRVDAAVAATAAIAGGAGSSSAFDVKLLAHKALLKALRSLRDDWRVWNNFMIVSVDCGMLSDAIRAMARVIEIKQTADAVDLPVLNRIIDAVIGAGAETAQEHNLWPLVHRLFEDAILPRFSSSAAIWRSYARLLLWRGRLRSALEAYMSAWRASYGAEASETAITTDRDEWLQAVDALQELCELLENYGEREVLLDAEGNECDSDATGQDFKREPVMANWRFRARSVVRAFMGRTKDAWEGEPDWQRLETLRASLAPGAA